MSRTGLLFSTAAIVLISLASCNKKEDTIGKVHVYNVNNEPVAGAVVRLEPEGTQGNLLPGKVGTTNASGEAVFIFNDDYQLGQAGVSVLTIRVDGSTTEGIIKIEEETTSEEKVFI